MKALAQKALVQKVPLQRSLKDAASAGGTVGDVAEKRAEKARSKAEQAGNGVIWSLLAMGLAACGGGTNNVLKEVEVAGKGGAGTLAGGDNDGSGVRASVVAGDTLFVGDGPIGHAEVWYDVDKDGVITEGVDKNLGETEPDGMFEITPEVLTKAGTKNIDTRHVLVDTTNGFDYGTNTPVSQGTIFKTISGQKTFTPLTTLLRAYADAAAKGNSEVASTPEAERAAAEKQERIDAHELMIKALFGEDTAITVEDILNAQNYLHSGNAAPASTGDVKANLISRKAIELFTKLTSALSEIDGTPTPAQITDIVNRLVKGVLDAAAERETDAAKKKPYTDAMEDDDLGDGEMIDPTLTQGEQRDADAAVQRSQETGAGKPRTNPRDISGTEDDGDPNVTTGERVATLPEGVKISLDDFRFVDFGVNSDGTALSKIPAKIVIRYWGGSLGIADTSSAADAPPGANVGAVDAAANVGAAAVQNVNGVAVRAAIVAADITGKMQAIRNLPGNPWAR